jgi:hypothetical protein
MRSDHLYASIRACVCALKQTFTLSPSLLRTYCPPSRSLCQSQIILVMRLAPYTLHNMSSEPCMCSCARVLVLVFSCAW